MAVQSGARPMRADAARNRQTLLAAARDAFARYGVTASLDDVARAAGVGPGTLYRHFPTRDDLVLAVIDEGLVGLARLGDEMLGEADPMDALRRWLVAYAEQGGMFVGLARTLVTSGGGDNAACRRSRDAGAALIERAVADGLVRADVTIDDVLDLAAATAWVGEQSGRGAPQRERLLELVLNGLREA